MLLEKEPLHNICKCENNSMKALRRGALVYRGPQDSKFKCLWVSELQSKCANVIVSSFSGHSSRFAGLG